MATGKIKKYVIWMTSIGIFVFPLTYAAYFWGAPVETAYLIFLIIYIILDFVRLLIMKSLFAFDVWIFIREVFGRIILVTFIVVPIMVLIRNAMVPSFTRFIIVSAVSVVISITVVLYIGLNYKERIGIYANIKNYYYRIR